LCVSHYIELDRDKTNKRKNETKQAKQQASETKNKQIKENTCKKKPTDLDGALGFFGQRPVIAEG